MNKVAIYCRLSEEDRNKKCKEDDSCSIQNQKLMLIDYAEKQGWLIYKIYSDDDYTGSDRNRPSFNQMLNDAKNKKFNIILCKTQSRFTRELEIVESYIHNLFPQWGIRFVSIVDNIDTDIVGNKKTRQINGLINEWYLEDMSDSIKAALLTRMKAGYHIGSFAPYGYKKDPNIKGHLIIDEEEALVVKEIFNLYNSGIGRTQIARILNSKGYPNPSASKIKKGEPCPRSKYLKDGIWKYYTVSSILENEVYIGNLIQGKTFNPTYKSHRTIPAPKEHWVRVEGTHEAIIDKDTWNLTRKLWHERTKPCYVCNGERSLFSGKIICKNCGYKATISYCKGKRYYRCTNRKYSKNICQGITVFESTLEKYIFSEFQRLKEQYLEADEIENHIDYGNDLTAQIQQTDKAIGELDKKGDELNTCIRNLYIDKLKGTISESQFSMLSSEFEKEILLVNKQKENLKSKLLILKETFENSKTKKEIISKYINCDTLTRPLVDNLINKIEVSGTKTNRVIDIYWNF